MPLELRDYQDDVLTRVAGAEGRGVRRQLVVAATGLGKTIIFTALARRRGKRVLVFAHRDELVDQAIASLREHWPDAVIGKVKAEFNEVGADVVVASVQTISRPARMAQLMAPFTDPQLNPLEPFDLVVVDEAHHATADSYRSILEALGAGTPEGPLLLGVTATPDRGDGKGLDDLFDEIVANYDLLWGIANGYLSDLRGLRVTVDALDLSTVRIRQGDYDQGQAGRALEDANAPAVIVKSWQTHAAGRRTLVFTPTVQLAQLVADEFNRAGIPAGMVHGGTPQDERKTILRQYSDGTLTVLANCAVLTEGYDEPRTDCIVMARPTKSRALYTQCVGRGTRKHPDKADCLVLDVVGASVEHSLVTVPSLFGLEGKQFDAMGEGDTLASDAVGEFEAEQVRMGRLRAEEAALFHKVRAGKIAWVKVHKQDADLRRYVRSIPAGRDGTQHPTVVLAQRTETTWTAGLLMPNMTKRALIVDVDLETAQGVAEDYVRRVGGPITAADAPWRKKKPSPKQLDLAKKWKIDVPKGATSGDVAELLDARSARIRLEEADRRVKS